MKRVLFATVAAAMMIAGSASAATVDINLSDTNVAQVKAASTTQAGLSAAAALGAVDNDSHVAADVTNAINVASVDVEGLANAGLLGANAAAVDVGQLITDTTTQLGASIGLSGSVTDDSSLSASVANVANAANVSVNLTAK